MLACLQSIGVVTGKQFTKMAKRAMFNQFFQTVQIVIADEYPLVLMAVEQALEGRDNWQVVATATTEEDLSDKLQKTRCDVLVYGLHHDEGLTYASLPALEKLVYSYPNTKVIVLAQHTDPTIITRILAAGCGGFIDTSIGLAQLPYAIDEMRKGGRYVDPLTTKLLVQHMFVGSARQQLSGKELTPREKEVIRLFEKGMNVSEIACHTQRSVKTIHTQKQSAMRKLGVRNGNELIDAFKYIESN